MFRDFSDQITFQNLRLNQLHDTEIIIKLRSNVNSLLLFISKIIIISNHISLNNCIYCLIFKVYFICCNRTLIRKKGFNLNNFNINQKTKKNL
jgi:hypothetical protein